MTLWFVTVPVASASGYLKLVENDCSMKENRNLFQYNNNSKKEKTTIKKINPYEGLLYIS